jgi:formate/nitrite transporter FocA (FNT family)
MSNTGSALLDFGAAPGDTVGRVTVTGQSTILGSSFVEAWIPYSDSADHPADEHVMAAISVTAGNIVGGTGFDIVAVSDHVLTGQFNVLWCWV